MNIAIQVTCLLTEAADEGVELTVVGNKLKVPAGSHIDAELRHHLREHREAIVERLEHDAAHPDEFGGFLDECCIFCATGAMGVPMRELEERYTLWARSNGKDTSSLPFLHRRLQLLGCEQAPFQSEPWLEHVALWQFGYVLRNMPMQLECAQQPKKRDYDPKASVEM